MKKIRILHVAATATGGVGLNILYLAKHLDREQFDLSLAMALGAPLDEALRREGVRIHPLRLSRRPFRFDNLVGLYQLWRLLRSERFDIVHTHTSVGGFVGRIAARARRVPVVLWSIHGWAFDYPQKALFAKLFRAIEKNLDRFTDHYVAVSGHMLEVGVRAGLTRSEKVSVIHHGIDLDRSNGARDDRLRAELFPEGKNRIIGTIGRIEPQKAISDFLHAARIVKDNDPTVKFLVVGDGPLRGEMENLASRLGIGGDVRFAGWQENVDRYIGIMDVVCSASRWEALPFLLLEVMAHGKPIVATDVGGVGEVVESGKNGILVPPAKPHDLATALLRLISDRPWAEEMGREARRRAERLFSVERMVRDYDRLYRSLLTGRAGE